MPFAIATEPLRSMPGHREEPGAAPAVWYYAGTGRWTKNIREAKLYDDVGAAETLTLLVNVHEGIKMSFRVLTRDLDGTEVSVMDPAERARLRQLAEQYRARISSGLTYTAVVPLHEPRIYHIGERQCECAGCVKRLLDLFPARE
jgi:hypothetical protein